MWASHAASWGSAQKIFKCMHACWRCAEANQLRATWFWGAQGSPIVILDFQNRLFHKSMRQNVNKSHHTKTFAHRKQTTFAHRKMLGPTACFWVQLHTFDAFRVLGQIAAWTRLDLHVLSKNTQWKSNQGSLGDDSRMMPDSTPIMHPGTSIRSLNNYHIFASVQFHTISKQILQGPNGNPTSPMAHHKL